jgi:hypothetical protein
MFLKTAVGLMLCSAIPASATTAYTATAWDQFGTVNLSTGASAGLGEVGGALYGAVGGTRTLRIYCRGTRKNRRTADIRLFRGAL